MRKRTTLAAAVLAAATVPVAAGISTAADGPAGPAAASAQESAKEVLADGGTTLLDSHVSGNEDPGSTAKQNVLDTSRGEGARTSPWSDVGVTRVGLSAKMMAGLVSIGKDHPIRVTTIAGGDHSSNSYHYAGTAVDIDRIDGSAVDANHPKVGAVKAACERLGAVEILGPGDPAHDGHVHCAWSS
ncbi:carboxypeptidase [Amycolatopsis antarctica]|uniref:carboxypeptidase n=1 Tax=Amycolatopsis antarctica TaxID=1854586 RepID=UPI00196B2618|nr:carboxypeptidase [Amycolatopsis antarctica]